MQNINTRFTLNTLCFEMLRANNYIEAEAANPLSAANSPRRSVPRRRRTQSQMFKTAAISPKTSSPSGKTMSNVDFTFKLNAMMAAGSPA